MTKRLHVLHDTRGAPAVNISDVPVVNAAHRRELLALAEAAGLQPPIAIVSTSPIQSPLTLDQLGLPPLQVLR